MTAGLTATGWVPMTATEVLADLETDVRAELGSDVDVSAESVFGPVLAVCATKLGQLWELVGAVYAARTASGASGEALAAVAGIFPALERRAATKGTVTLSVTLNNGVTIPSGSRASVTGEPANAWVTTASVTNSTGSATTLTVAAEALDTGRTPAPAGTITVIATPVSGWTAVTNLADATAGLPVETDAAFRLRREQSAQRAASSPLDAIVAQVLEVSGVTQVTGWENTSLLADSIGRPGKSVEVMVLGGTDDAVGRAVFAAKAGGIETVGSTTVSFTDTNGVSRSVKFSRPTSLTMYATIRVEVDVDTYAGDDAVKAAFLEVSDEFRAGSPARISDLLTAVCAVAGVVDAYVFVGTVATEALQQRTNYAPGERERCVFATGRITVTRGLS